MKTIGLLLIVPAVVLAGWGNLLAAQVVGDVFRDCDVCPQMVVVPPGSFMMGSPDSEEGRVSDEGPRHRVTSGYAFAVAFTQCLSRNGTPACARAGATAMSRTMRVGDETAAR